MLLPQSLDITWFELERLEDKINYCYIDLFDCFDAFGHFFFFLNVTLPSVRKLMLSV